MKSFVKLALTFATAVIFIAGFVLTRDGALARLSVLDPENPDAAKLLEIESFLSSHDMPVEIVWGINDPRLGKRLVDMKKLFPSAPVVETESGHFLQEEVPNEVASAVKRVLEQIRRH